MFVPVFTDDPICVRVCVCVYFEHKSGSKAHIQSST